MPNLPTIGYYLTSLLFTCIVVSPLLSANSLADEWDRVYEADKLIVDRREYQGSDLQEIRGVTQLEASLNAIMALLKDADFNRHWVYRSGGATILEQSGYARAYVYGIVDAPWPMRDRDTVVRFDYEQESGTGNITITITNFPDFVSANDHYVRVPDFGGFWKLRPLGEGWVEVTYQVYGDPGGLIPVWLANYAAAASVIGTLQNMSSAVSNYEGARSAWVRE